MSSAIRLEEYGQEEEILSLEPDWKEFQVQATQVTVFAQPAYVTLWAKMVGKNILPRVLTAWEGERLVGYAPFMETVDRVGPLSVPTLRFLGNNYGQPGDILYADVVTSGRHRDVVEGVLRHCRQSRGLARWDLGFLPSDSLTLELIPQVFGPKKVRMTQTKRFAHIDAPGEWEEYLSQRSRNFRKNLKRHIHRLRESGDLDLTVESEPEAVAGRVEEMVRNHIRWWAGTPREAWFGDERVHRFLTAAAKLLARQGRSLAATLTLDGNPIAWNVGALEGPRFFGQLISFDRTYEEASPGMVLSAWVIRHLTEKGARRYDLGPGFDQRKQSLGATATPYLRASGYLNWMRIPARLHRYVFRRRAAG